LDQQGTLRYFALKNIAFCNIDQPLLGKAGSPSAQVTSSIGYVRQHGRKHDPWFGSDSNADRYNYLYSEPELQNWEARSETIAAKTGKTFVVTNSHFEGKTAVDPLQLKGILTGASVRVPPYLRQRYWELSEISSLDE